MVLPESLGKSFTLRLRGTMIAMVKNKMIQPEKNGFAGWLGKQQLGSWITIIVILVSFSSGMAVQAYRLNALEARVVEVELDSEETTITLFTTRSDVLQIKNDVLWIKDSLCRIEDKLND